MTVFICLVAWLETAWCNFLQFLVFKALDPDLIRIRIGIGIHLKMLDPNPESMNPADPEDCCEYNGVIYIYLHLFLKGLQFNS